ncbi:MAG: serine/threonine protein kinase [Immundisolibacteraceae bacterium]|nr:serine/threonine protein kinase [Immundisolibacteraceae bacterium]
MNEKDGNLAAPPLNNPGVKQPVEDAQPVFADLAPDQLLDAVESTGLRVSGAFLALNSYENRVYRIDLSESPIADQAFPQIAAQPSQHQPVRVVAKFYRPGRWSAEQILEEHRFTQQLAEGELPVIAPLADREGRTLFEESGHRFALYPNVGGRAPELDNPDQLEQIGRLVGRIHGVGATEKFAHRVAITPARLGDASRETVLQNQLLPDYLKESYASISGLLLEMVRQAFERTGEVRQIRLHGDLHPGNLLWTDAGPHLVDFDDAVMGPAIQDLWMFLSGDRHYRNARLGDLLVGYEQFREFDARELNLIEPLRTLRMIHHVAWIARRWQDPAFPIAFPAVGSSGFWEGHINTLQEQEELLRQPALVWD